MNIVFLGGTRFIGKRAAELAAERGHSVSVFHRGVHSAVLPEHVRAVVVDRDDPAALSAAVAKAKPDVLVDTFAMTGAQTQRTVEALRGHVDRLVVLSSQDVYAQLGRINGHPFSAVEERVSENSPLTVRSPPAGDSDYDKQTVEARYERASRDSFAGVAILRLPAVFGSGDYQRRFGPIVDRLDSGNRVFPCQERAKWRWTHAHVSDVAHAILLAAEEKGNVGFQVFNVGERHTPTMGERVDRIARLMGTTVEWTEVEAAALPPEFAILGTMPNDFVSDSEKIRSCLGYREILGEDERYSDVIEWVRKSRK